MEIPERVHHSLHGHTILLVDDSEDDVFILQRAFRKAEVPNAVQTVGDGEEAIAYLEGAGKFADREKHPFPIAIFLDLNMPKKSGFEVLEHVRHSTALRKLVVHILSSSTRPADIDKAAALGANAYFIKPTQIEKIQELVHAWYNLARFQAYSACF